MNALAKHPVLTGCGCIAPGVLVLVVGLGVVAGIPGLILAGALILGAMVWAIVWAVKKDKATTALKGGAQPLIDGKIRVVDGRVTDIELHERGPERGGPIITSAEKPEPDGDQVVQVTAAPQVTRPDAEAEPALEEKAPPNPAPVPPSLSESSSPHDQFEREYDLLARIAELRDRGVLTEDEFDKEKQKILQRDNP